VTSFLMTSRKWGRNSFSQAGPSHFGAEAQRDGRVVSNLCSILSVRFRNV
jgi:hypothetical protein